MANSQAVESVQFAWEMRERFHAMAQVLVDQRTPEMNGVSRANTGRKLLDAMARADMSMAQKLRADGDATFFQAVISAYGVEARVCIYVSQVEIWTESGKKFVITRT